MKDIDYYLNEDHAARGRTTILSVIGGVILGAGSHFIGASASASFALCVLGAGGIEVFGALGYRQSLRKNRRSVDVFPLRRYILRASLAAICFLVASILRIPGFEANAEFELQRAADNPSDPQNVEKVKEIFATAKAKDTRIAERVVKDTGLTFIDTTKTNPHAWAAVQQYLDYRSYLNANYAPLLKKTFRCDESNYKGILMIDHSYLTSEEWDEIRKLPAGSRFEEVDCSGGDYIPPENSARLEWSGTVVPPVPPNTNIAFFRVRIKYGMALVLDGMNMKNVIIENSKVVYHGELEPPILDHVWFINCTFFFPKQDEASRQLSKAILGSVPVTFPHPLM